MSQCYICRGDLYKHTAHELVGCLKYLNKEAESCWFQLNGTSSNHILEIERAKAITFLSTNSINLNSDELVTLMRKLSTIAIDKDKLIKEIENIIYKHGYAHDNAIDEIQKLVSVLK